MKLRKCLALCLAAVLLCQGIPLAGAASSSQIRDQINDLKVESQIIQDQLEDVEQQLQSNWEDIEAMVEYKSGLDQQIFLLYTQMENLNGQITAYTTLIAQTQQELDEAQNALEGLTERYRARVRAMEEEGDVSYWEVLFKSKNFTDLIDRLHMVQEIAEADQRLMAQMQQATQEVKDRKAQLEQEKKSLEESRTALEANQTELEDKRAESDRVLQELNRNQREMEALEAEYDAQKEALADEIAAAEVRYNEAKKAEEEERRRREEEERKRREEEARKEQERLEQERLEQENATKPTEPGSTGSTEPPATEPPVTQPPETEPPETEPEEQKPPTAAQEGWKMPCRYIIISSPYGWRSRGWHNGVDFANNRGTPIYATRSGTVTTTKSLNYSYGNYVVVNHGDGFSSLYAHLDYYVVRQGDYVKQGQLLGYMGSSGNSTGNHLHFTIFYNGDDVNPMNYL